MALVKCRECGKDVSTKADKCPNCGAPVKKKTSGCAWVVAILFGLFLIGSIAPTCSGPSSPPPPAVSSQPDRQKSFNDAKARFEASIAERYKELVAFKDAGNVNAALPIVRQFENFKRLDYQSVAAIAKDIHTNDALARLDKSASTDIKTRSEIYAELAQLHPENEEYKQRTEKYAADWKRQEAVRIENERKAAAERERLAARKRKIEEQFSPWDGSHRQLERIIKKSMNDPDSYKHDETVYNDMGDYIIVKTSFRGKNAFGGVVRNWIRAKFDLDGNLIGIIDQGP